MKEDNIFKSSISSQFANEKLRRFIKGCKDIELLKKISIEILEMNNKKRSIDLLQSSIRLDIDEKINGSNTQKDV